MNDKLKRRKLDALKRGIHRLNSGDALRVSTHVVGIGKAGAGAVAEIIRDLEPDAPKFSALVLDIGDHDLADLRALAATISPERAEITIVALEVPDQSALLNGLLQYPEFLTLEYPQYYWGSSYAPWLSEPAALPASGHYSRAVAKAIYGLAYYGGQRMLRQVLRNFAAGVEAATSQAVVAIIFGLGGGTGSGIAVDLSRHLSSALFGRRILVAGVGVAPCDGDIPEHRDGRLFPVLNELDCLGDEEKNRGVVSSCGELFRNPFTAGFIMIPQQHAWTAGGDLAATHTRCNQEIASLLSGRGGINLWETLRLLNWVAAPSTQHSAARTPWGAKWIHMLGFIDAADAPVSAGSDLPERLGILPGYVPEFIEVRVGSDTDRGLVVSRLEQAFRPDVPPQIVEGGRTGSIQFLLPSIAKTDLGLFYAARDKYDAETPDRQLLDHALLLEQGVLLSEPSTRLEGMAGASLGASESWIAVSLSELRGEEAVRTDASELQRSA